MVWKTQDLCSNNENKKSDARCDIAFSCPVREPPSVDRCRQHQLNLRVADYSWTNHSRTCHFKADQRTVKFPSPEAQEFEKIWKVRWQVKVLPDVHLHDMSIIRQVVEDLRCCQVEATQLPIEVVINSRHRHTPLVLQVRCSCYQNSEKPPINRLFSYPL